MPIGVEFYISPDEMYKELVQSAILKNLSSFKLN